LEGGVVIVTPNRHHRLLVNGHGRRETTMAMLVRMSQNVPFAEPVNAWERSVNWMIYHYPISVYFGFVVPFIIVPLWVLILA
jgi:hypothetical protein